MLLKLAVLVALAGMGRANLGFSQVEIDDGGYTGLVIAIHPDVDESEGLINAIKQSWTEASKDLFIATGNRAYFKQIKILVPQTWTEKIYDNATGSENYDQADVVIAAPNPSYGNEPYTVQHEGCGQRGIRTHYTPAYLLEDAHVTNYGSRGKVIVHEWAHYRWGVFDETSETDRFYWDPRYGSSYGPVPTTCPEDVSGEIIDVASPGLRRCNPSDIDQQTNSYPENCVFFPFANQYYPIYTSVMAYQYLEDVVTFCKDEGDQGSDKFNVHNIYALNSQNRICNMRSTWSVIRGSIDYTSWNVKHESTATEPNFSVIKRQVQRFVLVLDDSGSMRGLCGESNDRTRSKCLQVAANQFIKSAPDTSYVGLVSFGSADSTFIMEELILLDSDEVRNDLSSLLVDLDGSSGSTCIGCGIEKGIKVLENMEDPAGGRLVVITDGLENEDPKVKAVSKEVMNKGVVIDTVFVVDGDNNQDLIDLTGDTGGGYYRQVDQIGLIETFSKLSSGDSTEDNSFELHSSVFVTDSEGYQSYVIIDATIGADTVFAFTWAIGDKEPDIYIKSPAGCVYSNYLTGATTCTDGTSSHTVSREFSTINFRIPGIAEVGRWIYRVEKKSGLGEMTAFVTSATASNTTQPIMVESGMSQNTVASGPAIIYAKVTQGYNPILGAAVMATVTGPSSNKQSIELYDNGAGSDIHRDDGIYSRYFTELTGPGRYAVEITVGSGNATSAETRRGSVSTSSANYRPGVVTSNGMVYVNPNGAISNERNISASMGVQSEDLGEFMRIVPSESFDYAGSVDVNDAAAPDDFPPSKITDLRMMQRDLEDYTKGVIIQFTATGDDYDRGTAAGYEFRYTYDEPSSLFTNFTSNQIINQSIVTKGNLSDPVSSGQIEEFILLTPELPTDANGNVVNNSRLAFAIRAYDSVLNYGEPSNVATINFFITPVNIPNAPQTTATTVAETTTNSIESADCNGRESGRGWLFLALCALAVTTGIFLTSTLILSIWLAKSNKQLRKLTKSQLRGSNNAAMYEMSSPKRSRLPKVPPSTSPGTLNPYDF